jgi:hypothetical protein
MPKKTDTPADIQTGDILPEPPVDETPTASAVEDAAAAASTEASASAPEVSAEAPLEGEVLPPAPRVEVANIVIPASHSESTVTLGLNGCVIQVETGHAVHVPTAMLSVLEDAGIPYERV